MKPVALAILGVFGLLLAVLLFAAVGGLVDTLQGPSYAELVAEQARADAIRQQAELEATWAPIRAAALNLGLFALAAGCLLYAARLALLHTRRVELERLPNRAGLLPVLAGDQDTARAALAGFHAARLEEARRPNVPASLTYSPSWEYESKIGPAALPLPIAELPQIAAPVPTFGELLDAGRVGRGHPLLLGFDAESGAELPGSWTDLYATATAGLPGSGKTTSQRFFAAQTALHGARFVVCDPHAGAADDSLAATLAPLRSVYLVEPADEPKRILESVRYVAELGEARVRGRDADTTPIILWVDELTGLLGRSDVGDTLAELLEKIAQEYRKRFIYLSASGQIWTAARATSELRDSLASVLCHRMKRAQARLLLPTEEAATVERLATGEAILWRTSGETTRVRIPNTTAADVRRVAQLLDSGATSTPTPEAPTRPTSPQPRMGFKAPPREVGPEVGPDVETGSPLPRRQDAANWTAEEARIVAALAAGKKPGELAEELAGGKGGRAYQEAAARIAAVISRLAARSGARLA